MTSSKMALASLIICCLNGFPEFNGGNLISASFSQLMCISILASLDHGFKNPVAVVATECRRPFRCVQSGTLAIWEG